MENKFILTVKTVKLFLGSILRARKDTHQCDKKSLILDSEKSLKPKISDIRLSLPSSILYTESVLQMLQATGTDI